MMGCINISLESYNYTNYFMEKDIYENIRDPEFANHFLGRLVSDCEYILNACMDCLWEVVLQSVSSQTIACILNMR